VHKLLPVKYNWIKEGRSTAVLLFIFINNGGGENQAMNTYRTTLLSYNYKSSDFPHHHC